ncbi:hypothetical protein GEMRC1_006643 [Eukaryota sp. GEM-RC1]
MISSGALILPSIAFAQTGPSMIAAYVLAGLLILPAMFSQQELSTAMPKSGLSYFAVVRSLGPFAGCVAGFISWLCIALKASFACVGLGTLFAPFLSSFLSTEVAIKVVALTFAIFFTIMNLLTVKGTGALQGYLVGGLLILLYGYGTYGTAHIQVERLQPFYTGGFLSFIATTALVFVSYGGLTKVVDVSEEVDSPATSIPRGMGAAFVIVNILYALMMTVTVGVCDADELASSYKPIALGAYNMIGKPGEILVDVAAGLAYATTALAGILSAARSPLAMSRDGILPEFLSKTTKQKKIPANSILVTFCFIAFSLLLTVDDLARVASLLFLLSFVLICSAVIVFRVNKFPAYRPAVKVPWFPYLNIFGIVLYLVLILDMGKTPLLLTLAFLSSTAVYYVIFGRNGKKIEPLITSTFKFWKNRHKADSWLSRALFEDELLQIKYHRDDIVHDIFDDAVKNAVIVDLVKAITTEELFDLISQELYPIVGCEPDEIAQQLKRKDQNGCPLLNDETGIFDVRFPESKYDNITQMMMIRSKPGLVFTNNEGDPMVIKSLFILVRSSNNWSFNMKSIASLGSITCRDSFNERWNEAKNSQQLKDLLLAANRYRFAK